MNCLNEYQTAASWTKKVGGPRNLGGLIFGAGLLSGLLLSAVAWIMVENTREEDDRKETSKKNNTFEVTNPGVDQAGLVFEAGDEFTVLSKKDGSVFIVMNDDESNPVYVSDVFLKSVSGTYSLY